MSKNPPLKLLITGKMGTGKDYAADRLVDVYHASRWSRTELMKKLAHALAPEQIGDPEAILIRLFPDAEQREEVRMELLRYIAIYEPEPGKSRRLYQDVTAICQDHDPLVFEVELADRINAVGDVNFSLIDDVRSAEAFEFFTRRDYLSLRIEAPDDICRARMLKRDVYLPSDETFRHSSETALDEISHDFVIDNSTNDPERLYQALDQMMTALGATVLSPA
jgi:dephospho-CoA kinase